MERHLIKSVPDRNQFLKYKYIYLKPKTSMMIIGEILETILIYQE